jgi:ferric-dicitrate binding protein FerR (iron transport regulator)
MLRRSTVTRAVHRLLLAATLLACLAPLQAQEAAARAITLIGDVSYLKDGASGYKWALMQGQPVQPGWIVKTGKDGYVKFQVSDGSTFEVFGDTEATFRQDPGNWTHLLNVWIGHIKVMIQHLPGVANPNNVTSPTAVISVRGTMFDVIVEDLEGTTLVSVDEGLVQVHHRMQPGPDKFLTPGQAVRVFPNEPLARAAVDRGNILMRVYRAGQQAAYEAIRQRGIGGGPVAGGTTSGAQGDKGKNGGTTDGGKTGSGGAPTPPGGAAPTPPGGAAPPPPGGPGGGG